MNISTIINPMNDSVYQLHLFTIYFHYWVLCILLCLLLSYTIYSRVLTNFLKEMGIPKLYKITIRHSLWIGLSHVVTSYLCFTQLNILVHSFYPAKSLQPSLINEILSAASINFCQESTAYSNSSNISSILPENPVETNGDIARWTPLNASAIILITAIFIQEILLATRNKMNDVFYSRLLVLIFLISAVRTRCPILSIQGTYLISINIASKEIARALVAWQSYSQEDSDLKISPVTKALTYAVFVFHMVIWFSLMLFYMPHFIHKLPSLTESDPDRLFLAYSYLSFLAYVVLEAGTSPLWTTLRCMGWCRRSSGLMWRILAVSDCHLLGHYSSLVLQLYHIQMILDQRKALFRNRMVQKHLASMEGRKRKPPSADQQSRERTNLLAAVKTVVALKKKIQRRMDSTPVHSSASMQHLPQIIRKAEDSDVQDDLRDANVETVTLYKSEEERKSLPNALLEEIPGVSNDIPNSPVSPDESIDSGEQDEIEEKSSEKNEPEGTHLEEDVNETVTGELSGLPESGSENAENVQD